MIVKGNKVSIFYAILRDGITIHVHLINTLEGDVWGVRAVMKWKPWIDLFFVVKRCVGSVLAMLQRQLSL